MSGPKTASYSVTAAAEMHRRAAAEAQARADRAAARYDRVRQHARSARRTHGVRIGEVPTLAARGLDAAQVEELAARAEQTLETELGAVRREAMLRGIAPTTRSAQGPARSQADRRAAAAIGAAGGVTGPIAMPARALDLSAEVTKQLERIRPDVPDSAAERLRETAAHVTSAPTEARARQLIDLLREDVQVANRQAVALKARAARAEELACRLDGRVGAAVDAARDRVRRAVDDGADWAELTEVVDRAVRVADRAADADFTARAVAESLAELGYEVEEGFEVMLAQGGRAHVRRPAWADHAVRVRMQTGARSLQFAVLTPGTVDDPAAAHDIAAEQEWCGGFDRLGTALADRGVRIDVTHRMPPGTLPVLKVEPSDFPFSRTTAGTADRDGGRRRDDRDDRPREREVR